MGVGAEAVADRQLLCCNNCQLLPRRPLHCLCRVAMSCLCLSQHARHCTCQLLPACLWHCYCNCVPRCCCLD